VWWEEIKTKTEGIKGGRKEGGGKKIFVGAGGGGGGGGGGDRSTLFKLFKRNQKFHFQHT